MSFINNWSIGKKMFMLTLLGIINLIAIQFFSFHNYDKIMHRFDEVANVELPAVRLMGQIDMMHDGVVGVVYKSIYFMSQKDSEGLKAMEGEEKEFAQNMKSYVTSLNKLSLPKKIKEKIESSIPKMEAYLNQMHLILQETREGDEEKAQAMLGDFQKSFDVLEVELGQLGEDIETSANESRDLGHAEIDSVKYLSWIAIIGCLFFSALFSFFLD